MTKYGRRGGATYFITACVGLGLNLNDDRTSLINIVHTITQNIGVCVAHDKLGESHSGEGAQTCHVQWADSCVNPGYKNTLRRRSWRDDGEVDGCVSTSCLDQTY